jgi:hypothetical protein
VFGDPTSLQITKEFIMVKYISIVIAAVVLTAGLIAAAFLSTSRGRDPGPDEWNVTGREGAQQRRGGQKNKLVGVWRRSSTHPGITSPIQSTISVEFRNDGTYTYANQADRATTGTILCSGGGRYTYANGVLTFSGGLAYLGSASVNWVGEDEFSTKWSDGDIWRWTRGR